MLKKTHMRACVPLLTLAVVACGGGGGGGGGGDAAAPGNPDGAGEGGGGGGGTTDTTVRLSGSLNLIGGDGAGLLLAESDTYDIYCVTFEDTPKACRAVITNNAFDEECEDYAGKAFGCFLRQNNRTVGDIVFDQGSDAGDDSQLVAGAGTIKVAVNFDPDLGVATAVVDKTESSALAPEAVAAVKSALGVADTSLPNLTGTYSLAPLGMINDDGDLVVPEGETLPQPVTSIAECDQGDGRDEMPACIHMNEWDDGGVRRVSIWESEAAKNVCLANGGTEQSPSFGAKVGENARVALDPSNLKTFRDSMGKIVGQFAKDYPVAFGELLDASSNQWEARRCAEKQRSASQAANFISADKCKLLAPRMREVKFWDPATNQEITHYEPTWYNSWSEVQEQRNVADANIQSFNQTCFNPLLGQPTEKFMPPCPPDWSERNPETATGSFTVYDYVNGDQRGPLQFVCQNPQDNSNLMFLPISAPSPQNTNEYGYFLASIDNAKAELGGENGAGGVDASCDSVTVADMFDNDGTIGLSSIADFGSREIYVSSRRSIISTFSEILRSSQDGWSPCESYTPPTEGWADFNLKTSCEQQDGETKAICWQYRRLLEPLAADVSQDGGSITLAQQAQFRGFLPPEARLLCPSVSFGSDGPSGSENFDQFQARKQTEWSACRTAFRDADWTTKLARMNDAISDPANLPPSVALQCTDDTATKDAIASIGASSCVPDLNIDFRCEGGNNCTEVLRCWGTEDGKCVDGDGHFQGRMPGRFEKTYLKLGTSGAFALSALTTETWNEWGEDGERVCKAANGFKLAGLKTADEPVTIEATLEFKETRKCEGENEGGEGEGEGDGGGRGETIKARFTKL